MVSYQRFEQSVSPSEWRELREGFRAGAGRAEEAEAEGEADDADDADADPERQAWCVSMAWAAALSNHPAARREGVGEQV